MYIYIYIYIERTEIMITVVTIRMIRSKIKKIVIEKSH